MTLKVKLGELEQAENGGLLSNNQQSTTKSFGDLGFSAEQLDADLASEYGLEEDQQAVIITEVVQGSPAAEKGLAAGDVVVRFGQRRITTLEQLVKGIDDARDAGRSGVLKLIKRDGQNRFIQISSLKRR